jgi:two-component system phosphate regulon response regulator PhoB
MSDKTVLIIEDEGDIRELIAYMLKRAGYRPVEAESGELGLQSIADTKPDLIILDLMLPGLDGLEVCRRLKRGAASSSIPILMLTAKSQDEDIVVGLEAGADDYVTKPFSPQVLLARVRAILRRRESTQKRSPSDLIVIHDVEIDVERHEVRCNGAEAALSATEFKILLYLARHAGWVRSRSQIITAVRGDDYPVTERSVDVQILGLRRKLDVCGEAIETVRGIGYRLRD